jgi:hypothetical protein
LVLAAHPASGTWFTAASLPGMDTQISELGR